MTGAITHGLGLPLVKTIWLGFGHFSVYNFTHNKKNYNNDVHPHHTCSEELDGGSDARRMANTDNKLGEETRASLYYCAPFKRAWNFLS